MTQSYQANAELRFECSAGADFVSAFTPVALDGVESLSSLYEHTVTFELRPHVDVPTLEQLDALLDQPASIVLGTIAEPHRAHGLVRSVELLSATTGDRMGARVVVVPLLWRLSLTRRTRIFENKRTGEIVQSILTEHGLAPSTDFLVRLTGSYTPREYTLQYDETDLAFVSRLLEYEGIFYYFEQGEERAKLVITDANANCVHPTLPEALVYRARKQPSQTGDVLHGFLRRAHVVTHKARVYDYNYRTPTTAIDRTANTATSGRASPSVPGLELSGEHVKTAAEAARIADLRAGRLASEHEEHQGATQVRWLAAGHTFTLTDHPVDALNRTYLVTSVRHSVRQGGADGSGYENALTAQTATTPFRPALRTPRPRVSGLLTAKVAGTVDGMKAPVDAQGRYKVTFMIDPNTATTRWTRLAQGTSGEDFGMHLPLHVGSEVLVAHVNGDPDRPVIVGALPHPSHPSLVTSGNPTQALFRTKAQVQIHLDDDA